MNILVTAGNTQTPIDKVRCLTNIFSGRTGAQIAVQGFRMGHAVTLLTSRPESVVEVAGGEPPAGARWTVERYRTFDDLASLLRQVILDRNYDAVIHSAAVSDYRVEGTYAPGLLTQFDPVSGRWNSANNDPRLVDRQAGKIKSDEPELWLRLTRTPKLVDSIKRDWAFRGLLVKFKLEVGIDDDELLAIAERSRLQSQADFMVANTLEGASTWAFLGPMAGGYEKIARAELPARLLAVLETMQA